MDLNKVYFEESGSESELEELEAAAKENFMNVPGRGSDFSIDNRKVLLIESLLQKNEKLANLYKQQEKVLKARLDLCRSKLRAAKEKNESHENKTKIGSFSYYDYGAPYFKDEHRFPSPINMDTVKMKQNDMLNNVETFSTRNWTTQDKKELNQIMLDYFKSEAKNKVETQRRALIRQQKALKSRDEISMLSEAIVNLDNEIRIIECKSLGELSGSIKNEHNWDDISAMCSVQRSPNSVRAMWQQYLHPTINKAVWTRDEHHRLNDLTIEFQQQDWEAVASQLGTGRSAYLCFIYFKTTLDEAYIGRKWSAEEDELLKKTVNLFKIGDYIPWGKVALQIKDRTKVQIYNRWWNHSKPDIRKGRFIPEEDAVILAAVGQFGRDFAKVSNLLPERSKAQLRTRYTHLHHKKSSQWTPEEDRQLLQLVAQQKFSDDDNIYSQVANFFPNKSRIQVRMRYKTLEKWSTLNPNLDLEFAPRKQARKITVTPVLDLKMALNNLSKVLSQSLPKTIKTESRSCSEKNSENRDADNLIINFFIKSKTIIGSSETEDCSDSPSCGTEIKMLKTILLLLQANLNTNQMNSKSTKKQSNMLTLFNNLSKISVDEKKQPLMVKTYSKKKPVEVPAILDNMKATIWCNTPTIESNHFLPPNYSTIIGLKMLMLQSSNPPRMTERKFSSRAMTNNIGMKIYYEKWAKRFEFLFLWPLILSNVAPKFDRLLFNTEDNKPVANISIDFEDVSRKLSLPMVHDDAFTKASPIAEKGRKRKVKHSRNTKLKRSKHRITN